MSLASGPNYSAPVTSSADQTITGGTAAALTSLVNGGPTQRIRVTAHSTNTTVIRVSGSDVTTSKGTPLAPGAAVEFAVANASSLYAIIESGSGKLCVSAV